MLIFYVDLPTWDSWNNSDRSGFCRKRLVQLMRGKFSTANRCRSSAVIVTIRASIIAHGQQK